jgi:hypothetical protein
MLPKLNTCLLYTPKPPSLYKENGSKQTHGFGLTHVSL